jgi:hypothetical protein
MAKQAIGTSATNYDRRMDKTSYTLNYPSRPLVDTRMMEFLGLNRVPSGCQIHVAIMSYSGYNQEDSVLINSNFNCGFYIQREKLHSILRSEKYKIEAAFDPCSYPGVKCKFYFNHEKGFDMSIQNGVVSTEDRLQKLSELNDNKKYTEVSFMIFRTGSVLIVGNCSESILYFIFGFIKNLLQIEYANICTTSEVVITKVKKTKLRTKQVFMTHEYWQTINNEH